MTKEPPWDWAFKWDWIHWIRGVISSWKTRSLSRWSFGLRTVAPSTASLASLRVQRPLWTWSHHSHPHCERVWGNTWNKLIRITGKLGSCRSKFRFPASFPFIIIHPILGHKLAAVAGRSMGMLGTQQLHLLDIKWHQGSCCVSNSCRRLLFFVASLLRFERFPSFCLWHTLTCRAVFTTGALDNAGQLTAATFSTYHTIHRQRANADWAFREETTRKKSIKKSWMTPRSCTVISAWCSSLLSKLGSAMHSSVPVNINFLNSMAASSRFHPEIWSETKQIVVRCSMVRCPCMSLQLVDWKDATIRERT